MSAPPEIIDSLESVVDIFLSGVRHRERAAFILCDNLVELACKTKAKQHNHTFNTRCNFHDAWNALGVQLPPRTLGQKVQRYRDTRNDMQHGNPAATVDVQYCASAITTAVQVIDRLWPNTSNNALPSWMQVALRIVRLYSGDGGTPFQQGQFEDLMRTRRWRSGEKEWVRVQAVQVQLGLRDYWRLAVRHQPAVVEECLNELGIS